MSKQLVVYISATGTTRRVAQNLAKAIDADLAEIVPVPPFTAQDIDWTDPTSRASRQHADRRNAATHLRKPLRRRLRRDLRRLPAVVGHRTARSAHLARIA